MIHFSTEFSFEGVSDWTVFVDGEPTYILTRSPKSQRKPFYWEAPVDIEGPSVWTVDIEGLEIPEGATFDEASRLVREYLADVPE